MDQDDSLIDHDVDDYEEDEDEEDVVTPFTKRKRAPTNNYTVEDLTFSKVRSSERPVKRQRNPKQPKTQRGVLIGVCTLFSPLSLSLSVNTVCMCYEIERFSTFNCYKSV